MVKEPKKQVLFERFRRDKANENSSPFAASSSDEGSLFLVRSLHLLVETARNTMEKWFVEHRWMFK